MLVHTAKKPFLLPCILLSSLLFTALLPGSIRQLRLPLLEKASLPPLEEPPAPARAGRPFISSKLKAFIQQVVNGNSRQVVGIYADDQFSHPIVQQPSGQTVFVSTDPDQVTQFGLPARFGTIGLLAHNNLAGSDFFKLHKGSSFALVYGSGAVRRYTVSAIRQFQALDPENPYSDFVDTQSTGLELSSADLFRQIYTRSGSVVFQTCIERDGEPSWGRMFITATPEIPEVPEPALPQLHLQLAAAF